jgi:hypothetical protein
MAQSSNGNGAEPSGSEFQRFESLLKRLVKVPKAEIDKARKKDEARKARTRPSP